MKKWSLAQKLKNAPFLSQRKNWDAKAIYKSYMFGGKWLNNEWWQRIHKIYTQSYLRLGKTALVIGTENCDLKIHTIRTEK